MQVLHSVTAATWAFVVLRWAPFPRWASLLFLAGYYPFFEYAVINRNYAIGGLLAAAVCALLSAARWRPLVLGGTLGLLAWTSAYGSLLTSAFLLVLAAEAAFGARLLLRPAPRASLLTAIAVGAAATAAAMADGLPAAGSGFASQWHVTWDLDRWRLVTRGVFRAFVPIPAPGVHFWNSNALDGHGWVQAGLGTGLLLLVWWLLRGHARARLLWLAASAALLAFAYLKLPGSMRHDGFFLLAAFCACWLAAASEREQTVAPEAPRSAWRRWPAGALLALHAAVALYATAMDLRHPFSASVELARWLKTRGLDALPIVAERDTRVSPLAGLLGKPLFYVRGQRWGTFVSFDAARGQDPSENDILAGVAVVEKERQSRVLVVLSDAAARTAPAGFRLVASFAHAIEPSETYVVYARPE
jgi:hypothetical protein